MGNPAINTTSSEAYLGPFSLWLIVLLEGFVTISAEILTIRQLIPYFGNTVITTSIIIGIFLLFLAYGYRYGGQYTKDFQKVLTRNFLISSIFISVGLSVFFIDSFVKILLFVFHTHMLLLLIVYLLAITAPLVFVLGQTLPITMNLYRKSNRVSEVGGNLLHLSTVGSFLGATITSVLLLTYFGVAFTVLANCVILFFLICIMQENYKKPMIWYTMLTCFAIGYWLNIFTENTRYTLTNSYGNYAIQELILDDQYGKRTGQGLFINHSRSSFIDSNKKGYPYIERVKEILFKELKIKNQKILILGAGGFTFNAESNFDNEFTFVEIDKDLAKIVEEADYTKVKGKLVIDDARQFVRQNPNSFDVIFSDVYSTIHSIPSHLLTVEFFSEVKAALRGQGPAVFNIIANPLMKDKFSQTVDQTLKAVFPFCSSTPLSFEDSMVNIIYVCHNPSATTKIYTENLNQSSMDYGQIDYKRKISE